MRRRHLRYTQTKAAVDKDNFAAGDNFVSNQEIDRIGDVAIQFHHVAGAEFKNLSKGHFAAAKTNCGLKFNIQQQLDAGAE